MRGTKWEGTNGQTWERRRGKSETDRAGGRTGRWKPGSVPGHAVGPGHVPERAGGPSQPLSCIFLDKRVGRWAGICAKTAHGPLVRL